MKLKLIILVFSIASTAALACTTQHWEEVENGLTNWQKIELSIRTPQGHSIYKYNSQFAKLMHELRLHPNNISYRVDYIIQEILRKNPNLLNEQDIYGYTPLMWAVQKGDLASVKLLLNAGVDVNAGLNCTDQNALAIAYWERHHDIINLLEMNGAKMPVFPENESDSN